MKKQLAILIALALSGGMLASSAAIAARPGGWRYNGPGGFYYQDKQLDRATAEKNAKTALAGATKGEPWKTPRGVTRIPLLNKDRLVIGSLWEDADLKGVEIGAYWTGRNGTNAELVSAGKVVGMLWLQ